MEIKNLKKAANRILKAIRNKEKIILYGDADLDGVASVIILKETIKNLDGEITAVYFPDREVEGYGITETGLNSLKKYAPAILVTLDLGIGNFKEVKLAKKLGFEVIIIDHHEILDGLPKAEIIVDPKQKGDKYPFKGLANAGICFKLSELLLKQKMAENFGGFTLQNFAKQNLGGLRKNFLELAALATIADMMPKENENLEFINLGLKSLENSWRPGIRAFFEVEVLNYYLNLNQKVSKIISLLNIRDVEDNLPASFRLLTSPSLAESKNLIERLILRSKFRKEKIDEMVAEIEKVAELRSSSRRRDGRRNLFLRSSHALRSPSPAKQGEVGDEAKPQRPTRAKEAPIVFEGDSNWDFTLISSVASIICHRYQKPTFIFKILEKESQGTVRTPTGIDSVALMKKCKRYLITYGGHPQASGFRIKNENLEQFKTCLIKQFSK